MPQGDEDAGEVEEALKDGNQAVVADLDAAEVLHKRWCVRFSSVRGIGAACVCLRSGDDGCCCGRERSVLCRAFSAVGAADRSHIRDLHSRVADGNGGVHVHSAAPSLTP